MENNGKNNIWYNDIFKKRIRLLEDNNIINFTNKLFEKSLDPNSETYWLPVDISLVDSNKRNDVFYEIGMSLFRIKTQLDEDGKLNFTACEYKKCAEYNYNEQEMEDIMDSVERKFVLDNLNFLEKKRIESREKGESIAEFAKLMFANNIDMRTAEVITGLNREVLEIIEKNYYKSISEEAEIAEKMFAKDYSLTDIQDVTGLNMNTLKKLRDDFENKSKKQAQKNEYNP